MSSIIIISRACHAFNCFGCGTQFILSICPKKLIIADEPNKNEKPVVIAPHIRWTASVSFVLFVCSTLTFFGWVILSLYDEDSDGEYHTIKRHKYDQLVFVSYLLYYSGKISLFILFLLRIYYSFRGSIYAVNNCLLISLAIFVILIVILLISYAIDLMYDIDEVFYEKELYIFESLWFFFFSVDVVLNAVILALFVSRLQMLGMSFIYMIHI